MTSIGSNTVSALLINSDAANAGVGYMTSLTLERDMSRSTVHDVIHLTKILNRRSG